MGAIPGAKFKPRGATQGNGLPSVLSCLIPSESGVVDLSHRLVCPVDLSHPAWRPRRPCTPACAEIRAQRDPIAVRMGQIHDLDANGPGQRTAGKH